MHSGSTELSCITASPEVALPPGCSKCAILQGPQRPGKKGKACSNCPDCKAAGSRAAVQPLSVPSSRASSDSAPKSPLSPCSPSAFLPSSLQRMSSCSGSSEHSAGSTSLHSSSSGSKSPVEPVAPSSHSSQKTDEGWEVQQRNKRTAPAEKQGTDGLSGTVSQARACRTATAPHPALAAAWQPVSGSSPGVQKPLTKDVPVHHALPAPASTEVLHLASGPVSFHPPPPPPPPRTRVTCPDNGAAKTHVGVSPAVGNAWNLPVKTPSHTPGASHNAWTSAVHQVQCDHILLPLADYLGTLLSTLAPTQVHALQLHTHHRPPDTAMLQLNLSCAVVCHVAYCPAALSQSTCGAGQCY